MPDENTTIEYKQLLDNGEPFYPMVGKSSYSEWLGYEEVSGDPPTDNFVLGIANGGTGASNAQQALISLLNGCTEYRTHSSTTATTSVDKTYTVVGSGLVYVSASVYTDATSDTGTQWVYIFKNGTQVESNMLAYNSDRVGVAFAGSLGSNASAMTKVSNGDTIIVRLQGTKNGTKRMFYDLVAFGCLLTTV